MNCIKCGEVLTPGAASCPKCGTVFGGQTMANNVQPVSFEQAMQQPVSVPVQPVVNEFSEPAPTVEILGEEVVQPVVQQPQIDQQQPVVQPMFEQSVMPAGMPQVSPIPVQQQPAPQPAVGGIIPSQHPTGGGKSKKGLIVILIILLVAGCVGGYFIYDSIQDKKVEEKREENKDKNDKVDKDDEKYEDLSEEMKKDIKIVNSKELPDGSILILVENKSNRIAGVDVEIEFYDAADKFLGTDTSYLVLPPNSERHVIFSKYSVKEGYESTDMNISVFDYTSIMDAKIVKETELEKNELEDEILLQYKNDTEYEMRFEAVCIFYLNNEVVYAISNLDSGVEPGRNANISLGLYELENISYDRYEIISLAQYDTYDD